MKTILSIVLCVTALLCGCSTNSYKAAGVVVITADRASDGWLDYYVRAKRLPGTDLVELEKRDKQVEAAYVKYQASMEALYLARNVATAEGKEAASRAASQAANAVVNLVFQFLPPIEANNLKSNL